MWKKLSIIFLSLCFCLLPVKNAGAEEFNVSMYNQEMEKTISVKKGDVIFVQVSDNSVVSYQCYVSDARIATSSLNEVTAIKEGKTTMTVLGYNEKDRLCFQSMLTMEVGEYRDLSDVSFNVNDNFNNSNDVNSSLENNNDVNSSLENNNGNINEDSENIENNEEEEDNTVVSISISNNGIVLEKGKKQTLKVNGIEASIKWTSSNKKIATVSSKGVVKGKKGGLAIITATVGEQKFGCAVNVVSTSMKKVVDNAIEIGNGTYNQSKRMEEGYYDCSSLVWRSYSPIGKTFGNKNWAPVSADIGKWCVENGTKISEVLSYEDIQAKKLKVGDLLFFTGANNGRYLGISHVELFLGYACEGIDNEGNVYLTTMCPARNNGYGYGSLVLRPKK